MVKNDYLERVLKARVYDVAIETPLELAARAVQAPGQPRCCSSARTCSRCSRSSCAAPTTRWRGLPRKRLQRGVIAACAGNHAQGVALAAQRLGCRAVIVMPVTTPRIKVDAVRGARRGGGAARRLLRRRLRQRACELEAQARPRVRASLRRSGRDRRAGHDRHGDPAPAARAARRDLRAGRRRRADLRHRRLREAGAARGARSSASSRWTPTR